MVMSFCAVLFPTRCLFDEILNLIESVSEEFPSYSLIVLIITDFIIYLKRSPFALQWSKRSFAYCTESSANCKELRSHVLELLLF